MRQMARNALFSRCRPISSPSSRSLAVRRREKGPSGPLTGYKESFISPSMTELLDIFRALADPTRLRIVALLREMELAIGELAVVLDQSQPRVSRHVRILVEAAIVERRREGSRSEERRGGKACVRTCRSWWAPDHKKKKKV